MASDAYMELETRTLLGESDDALFGMGPKSRGQAAFEIANFSFSATSNRPDDSTPTTPQAAPLGGNRQPAGRGHSNPAGTTQAQAEAKTFTISKAVDYSSPDLFQLCVTQDKIKWAVVSFREAGDPSRKPWLVLEFFDVYIDNFSWNLNPEVSGEEIKTQESLTFTFGSVIMKYMSQDVSGNHPKPPNMKGWNQKEHKIDVTQDLGSEKWGIG